MFRMWRSSWFSFGASTTLLPLTAMAIDYSSKDYWHDRLLKENDVGFEWLVPSSALLSIISKIAQDSTFTHTPIRILHFGCGSSTLGPDIQQCLEERVAVSDADYASASLSVREPAAALAKPSHHVPLYEVDVLDLASLKNIAPTAGWDLLIDKSTADAISCSPPLVRPASDPFTAAAEMEALQVLCDNLSEVSSLQCRWISISYSSSRFDFLASCPQSGWQVLDKFAARLEPTISANEGHVVHQPETGTWVWVLGRR